MARILVDLDDTLVDMMSKAVYYYNSLYITCECHKKRLEDIKEWELPTYEVENWRNIWKIPGFFADLPPHEGALDVLTSLSLQGHEIVIVSAVPTWESCKDKYQWCHTHLRIPGIIKSMDQVILTRGKDYVQGDIMIDDNPKNLKNRLYPILFDRPWNQKDRYPRAFDWEEVLYRLTILKTPEGKYVL